MRLFYILLLGVFLVPTLNHAQTEGEEEQGDSRVYQLGERTYVYKNRGGNIGLYIGKQGTLVIDTQFADITEDLLKVIGRFTDKPIQYVLNTHHHGDHTGGNGNLSREGALIISHDNVYASLEKSLLKDDEKGDTSSLPNITTSDELTFYFSNEKITVHHLESAHTNGDLMVFFTESNILHTGDAFVNGRYPYVDSANGGSYQGYVKGLGKILKVCDKDTKIIPGHGEVANMQDVRSLLQLLEIVYKRVAFHHLNGKSEAEIIAMTDLTADYDAKGFGDHFITREQFMKMIHDDVAAKYNLAERAEAARRIEEMRKDQARERAEEQKEKDGGNGGR
ncbi:MBL fold metallo-hydrolase [Aureitalea sp. L0-47]|uniref:MBL fold metallo-hydrolase n=1 Tax=Aureitalea sp. L0-47 TaxID=2816962 RepID=UPI002238562B|nr:MBL fold metallo-hydrolase [Aureitalea sp. L0-47]MCW5518865.1 MBL fold metallo-hydrolase [Aureitalea sp. L0-47]